MKNYYVKLTGNDTFKEVWRGEAESLLDALHRALSYWDCTTIERFIQVEIQELNENQTPQRQ